MNKNRSMVLMIAVLTGAIGAMLVYLYVTGIEKSTTAGLETRPVLVATRFLPEGSPGEAIIQAQAFEIRDTPAKYVSPGALTSQDELQGLILSQDVAGGEQLTERHFSQTQTGAFFTDFPKGTEAMALPLDYIQGVAGKIQAGDKLDAFVTVGTSRAKPGEINVEGGVNLQPINSDASFDEQYPNGVSSNKVFANTGGETFLMMRELLVMEVLTGEAAAGNPGSMILAVRPDQAALLIHAQSTAKLWFTLVPPEEGSL